MASRLLHAPVLHDENATSSIAMLKSGATGGGLGKMALVSTTKTEGRRALGNITNRAPAGSSAQPSAGKAKPSEAVAGRRALGDITNSVAPKQPGLAKQSAQVKPVAAQPKAQSVNIQQQAPAPQQQSAVKEAEAAVDAVAALQAKAELYALDGIEQVAGKGWAEQEADRARRQDAQVQQRLLGGVGLGLGAPHWAGFAFRRQAAYDACSSDDDALGFLSETPPMSPKTVRPRYVPDYSTPLSAGGCSELSPSMTRLPLGASPAHLDFFAMLPELSFGASPAQ